MLLHLWYFGFGYGQSPLNNQQKHTKKNFARFHNHFSLLSVVDSLKLRSVRFYILIKPGRFMQL